jgi:hypothetical protein
MEAMIMMGVKLIIENKDMEKDEREDKDGSETKVEDKKLE